MKKILTALTIILLFVLGKKSYTYYKKYRHSKRLKISVRDVKIPKLNLSSLLSDILAKVHLNIENFSPSNFSIQQISIDIFGTSGKLVAEQKNPLKEALTLKPNQSNIIALTFLISSHQLAQLIKEAGGIANVGANFLSSGKYGIPIRLKGFVVAENFTIDIDESLTI